MSVLELPGNSGPIGALSFLHQSYCVPGVQPETPRDTLTGTYMQAGTQMYVVVLNCRQQRLATWISSIAELHKSRPAAAVAYSRPMPDVELLMQVCGTAAVQPAWQQSHVWISTWRGVDLRFRSLLIGGGWGGCSTAAHYSP